MLNQGFTYSETVGGRGEGRALLAYLASRYAHTSEADWSRRLSEGRVLLDGLPAHGGEILRRGQRLEWRRPPWSEPEVPLAYEVLYEDADLLAVAKPSGLPTLPGGGFLEHTLLARVRLRFPEAAPLHRLGRGTSGLVLFARRPEAYRRVAQAWRERRVSKTYAALVRGRPEKDEFAVDAPIGPVAHPLLEAVHAASPSGKPSRSEVRVLERRGEASLVEVRIPTGRPHQIRIHMAFCGHPLVGDPLYAAGGGFLPGPALPGDTGYLLHALRLELAHPATGRRLELYCPAPAPLMPGFEG